ncbi:MAG: Amicyanin [Dehalococcoidia bacterium]|nr:Amicyanin [Chloroflexota bacterium]MBT9162227.1 Amicyanin [Chloroflexota bacterium]
MLQAYEKGFFIFTLVSAFLLMFVTLACPPAPAVTTPAEEEATPEEVISTETTVTIEGFAFNPREVKIKAGGTVIWQQKDSAPHTVTSDDGKFDSGSLNQGENWSFTFEKPGIYEYHCRPHPWMKAKVIVE